MKGKFFCFLICCMLHAVLLQAQDLSDNFYIKVMQEELQRNVQRLHLPDLEKPFFIAYNLRNQYTFNLESERGEILSHARTPNNNKSVSIKLRVGDYHRNFDYMMYDGYFLNLPDENDADELRRLLWLETDRAYKNNAQQYSNFMSALKRVTVDEKELALDDLSKITPLRRDFGSVQPIQIDTKYWEKALKSLSARFNAFPTITTSSCRLTINNSEDYLVTSEGTVVRKPGAYVTFSVFGATSDEEGNNFNDNYTVTVKAIEELPSFEQLDLRVKEVIEKIGQKQQAKPFEEAYLGPVLFTGNAVSDVIQQCFSRTFQARRKPILGYGSGEINYEDKIGQKLVAADLTVMAIPSLKKVNGKSTTGYFEIDDEGVVPADSLVLIRDGILKALLSGRTPTRRFPQSQGFAQSFTGQNFNAGVLRLVSAKTIKSDSMVAKLLQLAKEEGLSSAYIIKNFSFSGLEIYKVDVATGAINMVNECKLTPLNLRSLRRFITASEEVQLENNSDFSIVAPQSVIINEIEIEKNEITTKPKPVIVSNPLLDASADIQKKGRATRKKATKN